MNVMRVWAIQPYQASLYCIDRQLIQTIAVDFCEDQVETAVLCAAGGVKGSLSTEESVTS